MSTYKEYWCVVWDDGSGNLRSTQWHGIYTEKEARAFAAKLPSNLYRSVRFWSGHQWIEA